MLLSISYTNYFFMCLLTFTTSTIMTSKLLQNWLEHTCMQYLNETISSIHLKHRPFSWQLNTVTTCIYHHTIVDFNLLLIGENIMKVCSQTNCLLASNIMHFRLVLQILALRIDYLKFICLCQTIIQFSVTCDNRNQLVFQHTPSTLYNVNYQLDNVPFSFMLYI